MSASSSYGRHRCSFWMIWVQKVKVLGHRKNYISYLAIDMPAVYRQSLRRMFHQKHLIHEFAVEFWIKSLLEAFLYLFQIGVRQLARGKSLIFLILIVTGA